MVLVGYEITFLIYDSYSLKDKRSVVKSITKRMHNKYNISISEVGAQDTLNQAIIGIGIVGNDRVFCHSIFDQVVKEMEENYEIEIHDIQKIEA